MQKNCWKRPLAFSWLLLKRNLTNSEHVVNHVRKRSVMSKRAGSTAASSGAKRPKNEEKQLKFDLTCSFVGESDSNSLPPLVVLDGNAAQPHTKVAAFDLDSTLIKTASGKKFPVDTSDWQFLSKSVPTKLRSLHLQNTRIVIFTNQAELEKKKTTVDKLCRKFENIINDLNIPVQLFMSTGFNHYRKPSTAMWDHFITHYTHGVKIDLSQSFYVGDAAGRPKNWKPGASKDFSPADRMFAANIGLQFHTPEEYFFGEPEAKTFDWGRPNPSEFLQRKGDTMENIQSETQEMVLLVGRPASGKSTFSQHHFQPHGYVNINRDTLRTQSKCLKAVQEGLKSGKSVVIDNTNPSKSGRAEFIKLAQSAKVPVRCFLFTASAHLTDHLNYYRMYQTKGKVRRIPDVAYRVYEKNYEEPELKEGLEEIKRIDFIPVFDTEEDEQLFKKWAH